jgi:hypothetical protein
VRSLLFGFCRSRHGLYRLSEKTITDAPQSWANQHQPQLQAVDRITGSKSARPSATEQATN